MEQTSTGAPLNVFFVFFLIHTVPFPGFRLKGKERPCLISYLFQPCLQKPEGLSLTYPYWLSETYPMPHPPPSWGDICSLLPSYRRQGRKAALKGAIL